MLSNSTRKQAVVVPSGTISPNKRAEEITLFNPDGTVYGEPVALRKSQFLSEIKGGTKFSAIGDSITAGQGSNIPTGTSWYDQMCARLQGRVINVKNAGVAADYSFSVDSRFNTDIVPSKPDVVFIMVGTNDIPFADLFGGWTWAATKTSIQNTIDKALTAGILPVLVSQIPRQGYASRIPVMNLGLAKLAEDNNILFLDFFKNVVDPTNGAIQSSLTSDGTHPNANGASVLGAAAASWVTANLPVESGRPIIPLAYAGDPNAQGDLWVSGNSGGIPTGWSNFQPSGTSVTRSIVTPNASDKIVGNWFRMTSSASAGWHGISKSGWTLVPGNLVQLSARIRVTNPGATTAFRLYLDTAGSSTDLVPLGPTWTGQSFDGTFVSRLTVPAGVTTGTVYIFFDTGSGSAEVCDIAELTLRDLTANGLV